MPKQSPTNKTTNEILAFFLSKGIYARRHGVAAGMASYTNKDGDTKNRFVSGGIRGGLDIFVWLPEAKNGSQPPVFLAIDIKTGKDRLRPEQEGFIASILKMGHLAMTVSDFPDFLTKFNYLWPR